MNDTRRVRGYRIAVIDNDQESGFLIENSSWAEQLIRGFVHSGFEVVTKEVTWVRPLTSEERAERDEMIREQKRYEEEQVIALKHPYYQPPMNIPTNPASGNY